MAIDRAIGTAESTGGDGRAPFVPAGRRARAVGSRRRGEALFDATSHTSSLGPFPEGIAADSNALLGSHQRAFSHLGPVNGVLYSGHARENRQSGPDPLGAERVR